MADLVFLDFTDGAIPTGEDVSKRFYEPTGGANSFETMNGGLDQNNRISHQDIVRRDVQRGTFSGGRMIGRTINLDYFSRFFAGFDIDDSATYTAYAAIPGCSHTFYLKYTTPIVIFSWSVMVLHDGFKSTGVGVDPKEAHLQFFVDGTRVPVSLRKAPSSMADITAPAIDERWGKERDRVYSGHHAVQNMAAGWHNVSLRLASTAIHTRVRCGSLRYIYFQ